MRIDEVISVKEDYADELIDVIQDLLALAMNKGIKKISTPKFIKQLAKQGYSVNTDELIQAVDASGHASVVNAQQIVPISHMDSTTTDEPSVDVGQMASNQAISDIKADL